MLETKRKEDITAPELICCGTITNDTINANGKKITRLGGAPFFFSNVCTDLGVDHSIITTIGKKDIHLLPSRDLRGIKIIRKTVSLLITENEQFTSCQLNSKVPSFQRITRVFQQPKVVFISPLSDEFHPSQFKDGIIALDLQGFMRNKKKKFLLDNDKKKPKNLTDLLQAVSILKCNELESKIIWRDISLTARLGKFAKLGPKIVVITRGAKGVVCWNNGKIIRKKGARIFVNDTVGTGDIFFSSFVAFLHKKSLSNKKVVTSSLHKAIAYTSSVLGKRQ